MCVRVVWRCKRRDGRRGELRRPAADIARLIDIPPRGFGADESHKTNTAAEAKVNEDDGVVGGAFSGGLVAWERKRRADLRRKSWLMDVAAAVD